MASNPNSMPATPTMRRAVTMPMLPRSDTTQRESLHFASSPDPQIETLFAHPSARVISFNAAVPESSRASSKASDGGGGQAGTLAWTSKMERTIAVGPLRIYRTPNAVVFLNCGPDFVRPLFAKSKCWCVEEASGKFVLERKIPQYWRIEVPNNSTEEIERMAGLKDAFSKYLLFEKTACPFRRNFTVELPEGAGTPVKYRPWRPRAVSSTSMPSANEERPEEDRKEEAMPILEVPEIEETAEISQPSIKEVVPEMNIKDECLVTAWREPQAQDTSKLERDITADGNVTPSKHVVKSLQKERLHTTRSVTAPPQLTLLTSPPSKTSHTSTEKDLPIKRTNSNTSDISSSGESFHSVQAWHSPITPLPPSPPQSNPASPTTFPYPHDNITLPKRPQRHNRDMSELTVTPDSADWHNQRAASSAPSTPSGTTSDITEDTLTRNLDMEHFEIAAPTDTTVAKTRHRATTSSNSRRRALSPLPPAANIFSPPRRRPRHLQTTRHLPTAILQKTIEILVSPPSHLVQIMLRWAARIARDGIWARGDSDGSSSGDDWAYDGSWNDEPGQSVELDDYGIAIGVSPSKSGKAARRRTQNVVRNEQGDRPKMPGGSWEID